jgi:glycyl-tRNA synthetase beta chain
MCIRDSYADAQGEPADVVAAIREHYAPKGPDDACPAAPASVVVALADKLDALTGFFAAGIRPTGSGDPFALRRAALGVIRLVLENGLRLDLAQLVAAALRGYAGVITPEPDAAAVTGQLADFLADRLKVQQRGAGTRHDLIAAVFATGRDGDLVRLLKRVAALGAFLATGEGTDLLAGYRRAANIVALEERKDGRSYREPVDPAQLVEPEERALHSALEDARATIAAALAAEDFTAAMAAVAELRGPIDAFFDRVMVNVADTALRANRLRLLAAIRSALDAVADFSLVEDAGRAR